MVGLRAQNFGDAAAGGSAGTVGTVNTGERARRAQSFGTIAQDYARFRPPPPAQAVDWLLPGGTRTVIDIGAGTGALTRLLVERVSEVIAVEPDARMRAVLAEALPRAAVRNGRAEALPVADASADAVLGSSMWHWVDEPAAIAEAARVVRPGGVLGVLWSGPDRRAPWIAEFLERPGRRPEVRAERREHREVHMPPDAPFEEPETMIFEWTRTTTVDALVRMAGTYSGVITMSDDDRREYLAALEARAREHPALAGRTEVEQAMRCFCWRAVRTG